VRLLKQDLDQQGIRSKQRIYGNGSRAGGQPFSRGALYALLSNPVYIGEIAHKDARYPGQHQAILDRGTWDSVQDQLRTGAPEQRGRATGPRSPLIGKVFDEAGHRLTPSHATEAGRRYRYYVSRPLVTETAEQHPGAWRIPATQLEHLIATEAAAMLAEPGAIAAVLENAGLEPEKVPAALAMADRLRDDLGRDAARGEALAVVVNRIELSPIRLRVILSAAALMPANPDAADAPEAVLIETFRCGSSAAGWRCGSSSRGCPRFREMPIQSC
jgi:site-specific DNA recombinase